MQITSRVQLVELMKSLSLPLVAVEVGVAEGIFSLELLNMGIEKLYLVDLWEHTPIIDGCASFAQTWHDKNYNDVLERLKDKKEKVTMLKGFSYKMAEQIPDESLGLSYVDGDHSYQGVKSDINSFLPKLVKGGIIAFHDFKNTSYGVEKAVREFANIREITVHELIENGDINNIGAYFIKQ